MNAPFQCWREATGDIWVSGGNVVALHSGGTVVLPVGGSSVSSVGKNERMQTLSSVGASIGQRFLGGSGRNYNVTGGPADPAFPAGYFRPSVPDTWISPEYLEAYIERDPGTGDLSLNDGTDEVATGSGGGSVSGTASAGTFPNLTYLYNSFLSRWEGVGDTDKIIYFEPSSGRLTDNLGFDVAVRASINGSDPSGVYSSTTYGADTYNGSTPWTYTVTSPSGGVSMTATTYGEDTYNGGSPFTFDIEAEGDMTGQGADLGFDDGTAQAGVYAWTGWQVWTSVDDSDWTITLDGTGAGEISDGTDVVATREADADRLYDPTGGWVSTSYGAATYGSTTSATSLTVSAGSVDEQDFVLALTSGDIETWNGTTNPFHRIELNTVTGDAILADGTDTIAERLGGSTSDIDGSYTATAYGEGEYNTGSTFTATVATDSSAPVAFGGSTSLLPKNSLEGYIYVTLELDSGTDEVDAVTGPFFAASLPANTSTEVSFPLCHSDGSGLIEQIQIGPIHWRPNP